jgi:hypothetical protein
VKNVFDDVNFDFGNLKESLQIIIKTPINDWRKYFINKPELIAYCEQGFIRFEADSLITLYKQSQQNHRQREMYSYALYLDYLMAVENYSPFLNSDHEEVRSGEDYSFAFLNNYCLNRINYSLKIYFDEPSDSFPNPYQIRFEKSKGDKSFQEYPKEIIDIMKKCNFIWHDDDKDWMGFWITEKTDLDTSKTIINLCTSLK